MSNQPQNPHWKDQAGTLCLTSASFYPGLWFHREQQTSWCRATFHKPWKRGRFWCFRGGVCPCLPFFQTRTLVQKTEPSLCCCCSPSSAPGTEDAELSWAPALGWHSASVGRQRNCPSEKQRWKGERGKGGRRPASSLGCSQIYGVPESSGQAGHPHVNDTGIARSNSRAWVVQEVRLR